MVSEGYWSFELIGAVFELKFKAKSLVWNAAKQWIFVFLFDFQFGEEKPALVLPNRTFLWYLVVIIELVGNGREYLYMLQEPKLLDMTLMDYR